MLSDWERMMTHFHCMTFLLSQEESRQFKKKSNLPCAAFPLYEVWIPLPGIQGPPFQCTPHPSLTESTLLGVLFHLQYNMPPSVSLLTMFSSPLCFPNPSHSRIWTSPSFSMRTSMITLAVSIHRLSRERQNAIRHLLSSHCLGSLRF